MQYYLGLLFLLVPMWAFGFLLLKGYIELRPHFPIIHVVKKPDINELDSFAGQRITMDFMVSDLHGTSATFRPAVGDVLILLSIDGMGVIVTRDQRGYFNDGCLPQESDPHNRLFDSFFATVGDEEINVKRYELRKCGLANRTWIVTR